MNGIWRTLHEPYVVVYILCPWYHGITNVLHYTNTPVKY